MDTYKVNINHPLYGSILKAMIKDVPPSRLRTWDSPGYSHNLRNAQRRKQCA